MEPGIYQQYPEMRYYRGDKYEIGGNHALIVIGESNYLEKGNTQHESPESWYSGNSRTLDSTAKVWINSAAIIEAESPKNFPNKAHSIYKLGFQKINEYGPRYEDYREIIKHIVFYNFFLRPAQEGETIRQTPVDVTLAQKHLSELLLLLKPRAVLFLSRKAYEYGKKVVPPDIICGGAPHPASSWWNRYTAKYTGKNAPGHEAVRTVIERIYCPHVKM